MASVYVIIASVSVMLLSLAKALLLIAGFIAVCVAGTIALWAMIEVVVSFMDQNDGP